MIFFDKDFGAKLNILAMGGKYLSIKTDTPTGINPLDIQFADLFDIFEKDGFKTAEVKQSVLKDLTELFCLMIKSVDDNIKIDPKTKEILTSTIKGTLKTASSLTAESYKENIKAPITTIIKHIPTSDVFSTDCLIALKKWTKGEMYGWIFDEHEGVEPLRIDCNETPILGIDGTEYLSNDSISPVINYYLLSRINKYIDGRRIILVFDECWQWIKNPTVCTFIQDKLKTMRKVNGIGVFATQSVEDLLNSNVGTTFIEQCDTKVLLSNTNAK